MRYASNYIERANDYLANDQHDYGGHRVAAMTDINRARADIASALAYDNSHPGAHPMINQASPVDEAAFVRSQQGSNNNLTYVRAYLERAIDMMQRDNTDYGGYRVKAIADTQAARDQIVAALSTYSHESDRSDDNIRFVRGYIARGVAMLNRDQPDYNGHRTAAINDMNAADADLLAAIRADRADESVPAVADLARPAMIGQNASDNNIRYVRAYVEKAIDMLNRDQHDYSGYRVKAIENLHDARQQLLAALASR
ncbi:MAG TPA: hypothetical protein VKT51_01265 [Candidatus Eremiobacteraceae bacterium]|nr:hypothetical protein [Candidatus Eremiobacteraceae bacterium]